MLSGLFFLLTVLTYVRAVGATGARRRWLLLASVVAHLAALLSKSITVMARRSCSSCWTSIRSGGFPVPRGGGRPERSRGSPPRRRRTRS